MNDYNNTNKALDGTAKFTQNRASRKFQVSGDYQNNVKFTNGSHKTFGGNKKSARDFSTGVQRFTHDHSLSTSKDELQSKKGKSFRRSKLPQIVAIDSKKYKSKLMRIESKTNTGLNLTNKEKKAILEKRKQRILEGCAQSDPHTKNLTSKAPQTSKNGRNIFDHHSFTKPISPPSHLPPTENSLKTPNLQDLTHCGAVPANKDLSQRPSLNKLNPSTHIFPPLNRRHC